VMDTQRLLVAEARAAHPSPVEAREASLVDLSRDTPSLDPVEARAATRAALNRAMAEASLATADPREDPREATMAPRDPREAATIPPSALRAATPLTIHATPSNTCLAPVRPTLRALLPRDHTPRDLHPRDQASLGDPNLATPSQDPAAEARDLSREDLNLVEEASLEADLTQPLVVENGVPTDTVNWNGEVMDTLRPLAVDQARVATSVEEASLVDPSQATAEASPATPVDRSQATAEANLVTLDPSLDPVEAKAVILARRDPRAAMSQEELACVPSPHMVTPKEVREAILRESPLPADARAWLLPCRPRDPREAIPRDLVLFPFHAHALSL